MNITRADAKRLNIPWPKPGKRKPGQAVFVPAIETKPPAVPGRWVVHIPGWLPPSLNVLMKGHWSRRSRLKREAVRVIYKHVLPLRVPPATWRRRVSQIQTRPGSEAHMDPDNAHKALLDALVRNRLLVDDSADWLVAGPVEYRTGPKGTTLIIEDIP